MEKHSGPQVSHLILLASASSGHKSLRDIVKGIQSDDFLSSLKSLSTVLLILSTTDFCACVSEQALPMQGNPLRPFILITKILIALVAHLGLQGIHIDLLIPSPLLWQAQSNLEQVPFQLQNPGCLIYHSKSHLKPPAPSSIWELQ